MKVAKMICEIPFSDGSENYKKGDIVIALPELEKVDKYAVGTDYCGVIYVDKKYLKKED